MTSIYFEVDAKQPLAELRRLRVAAGGVSLRLFMQRRAQALLQERTKFRFDSESYSGGRWAPLKWVTNERFRIPEGFGAAPPASINVRTGGLSRWLGNSQGKTQGSRFRASLHWPGPAPTEEDERKLWTAQRGRKDPPTVPRPVVETRPSGRSPFIAFRAG